MNKLKPQTQQMIKEGTILKKDIIEKNKKRKVPEALNPKERLQLDYSFLVFL